MISTLRRLLLFSVILMLGCSGREAPVRKVDPPGRRIMKAALEEIATTGKLGDSIKVVKEQLDSMAEDSTKMADALKPDYDQLISLKDPAAIKTKAKEMAGKL